MADSTHGADCPCPRCTGFQPGHELSRRHGAYAVVSLKPRAAEIAEQLSAAMDQFYSPRFEAAIAAAAMTGAQLEAAHAALADVQSPADLRWLREDARAWTRLWLQSLDALGLTPTSAAKLGLTIAQTGDELARYLAANYGDGAADGERGETS